MNAEKNTRITNPPLWAQRAFAWAMHRSNRILRDAGGGRKSALLGGLSGRVLEIGPGTGANACLYPPETILYGVEPNRFMFRYLRAELDGAAKTMTILRGRAECLGFADNSMDAVVSTHVLCSVDDIEGALAEVRRVLKPGGRFVFLEHVAAPRCSPLRRVQRLLRRPWRNIGEGCRLDGELWRFVERAGFAQLHYEHFRVPWASLVAPHIAGWATAPGE